MDISIVIPTLNEEDNLPECIELLEKQMYGGDELIVVDGGSDDNTVPYSKEHADKVFIATADGEPSTIGAARHVGVLKAENEVVAQTDADGRPPDGWLETIRHDFENDEDLTVLWGNIEDTNGVPIRNMVGKFSTLLRGASGNNTAFRKEKYMELKQGYPNVNFMEDTAVINNLAKIGKAERDEDLVMRMNMERDRYQKYPIVGVGATSLAAGHIVGGEFGNIIQGVGIGLAGTEVTYEKIVEDRKISMHHDSLGAHVASLGGMIGDEVGHTVTGAGIGMILHHWVTEGMSFAPTPLQALSSNGDGGD